jgi:HPt (histidine-containing phosphotransfer) domain-containing protein
MPARIGDLRAALARAAAGDPGDVAALVDGLHRLAGNAGTFGHADISTRARDLEDALLGPATGGSRGLVLADVARFLDDLDTAFPGVPDA